MARGELLLHSVELGIQFLPQALQGLELDQLRFDGLTIGLDLRVKLLKFLFLQFDRLGARGKFLRLRVDLLAVGSSRAAYRLELCLALRGLGLELLDPRGACGQLRLLLADRTAAGLKVRQDLGKALLRLLGGLLRAREVAFKFSILGSNGCDAGREGFLFFQRCLQFVRNLRNVDSQFGVRRALQRQQVAKLGHLPLQLLQGLVPPGQRRRQEDLADHEDHEDEDDDQQEAGQAVHEAGPDVDRSLAVTAGEGIHPALALVRLLRQGGNGTREQAEFVAHFLHHVLAAAARFLDKTL